MASKGRKKPSLHDIPKQRISSAQDVKNFCTEVTGISDRATALVAAAYIEHALIDLLLILMIHLNDKEKDELFYGPTAILSSLSAKTRMAYVLGLISQEEKHNIDRIREIRNVFAHTAKKLSFKDELLIERVSNIKIYFIGPVSKTKKEIKLHFVHCSLYLINLLKERLLEYATMFVNAYDKKHGCPGDRKS